MGVTIEILCTSPEHPVNEWLQSWMKGREPGDTVRLVHSKEHIASGDVLFLISCSDMIGRDILDRFGHSAVIHASDLPEGRGWSPHIWSVIHGAKEIVVSALEAAQAVDSGRIWTKQAFEVPVHALHNEINEALFETTLALMTRVCEMVAAGETPVHQPDRPATYWPRRKPSDSEINPELSIAEQFDLLRVCDPDRYPAFFHFRGHTYRVTINKLDREP